MTDTISTDEFDDVVATGFAALVLDHTATAMGGDAESVGTSMASLANATKMPLELCAGIILAGTALAMAGELDADMVREIGDRYTKAADDDAAERIESGETPENLPVPDDYVRLIEPDAEHYTDNEPNPAEDEPGQPEIDFSMFGAWANTPTDTPTESE